MNSIKNTGKIIGAFFLIVMLLWYIGFALIDPILDSPDYLILIPQNQTKITIGVLSELIEIAGVMGITFLIFPILKKYEENMAIAYVGFRVFECIMLLVALICPLILITLSQQYTEGGVPDNSYFQIFGILLIEIRQYWSLFILSFFHPLAALIFYYYLYQTKLVPKFLSVWGFLAASFLLIDQVVLESFGLGLGRELGNIITGSLMGLNEIALGIWLLIKGFNPSVIIDKSVKKGLVM